MSLVSKSVRYTVRQEFLCRDVSDLNTFGNMIELNVVFRI